MLLKVSLSDMTSSRRTSYHFVFNATFKPTLALNLSLMKYQE